MSASKYSEEFKQQVVLEVVEKLLHDQRGGTVLQFWSRKPWETG